MVAENRVALVEHGAAAAAAGDFSSVHADDRLAEEDPYPRLIASSRARGLQHPGCPGSSGSRRRAAGGRPGYDHDRRIRRAEHGRSFELGRGVDPRAQTLMGQPDRAP